MFSRQVRCAIYTRKSSEEGLEQSFNSLQAQREACVAYISSQKHEGWTVVKDRYDDGGFSGGTIERPAMTRLLRDVSAGKVETVIVYKVDRLTRSLADFAKIIEVFDSHQVSFVSVTQQFNTTTSMGRLTLNVLLSFAQFERELTGERIRDKIAASKKKGMWMGGTVPLGYDCVDHRLVVNQTQAKIVREIFILYVRLGTVGDLRDYLQKNPIPIKIQTKSENFRYSRGALYHLLKNKIYIGRIVHFDQSYPGRHERIVPQHLWDKVQKGLADNNQAHRRKSSSGTSSMLAGKVFDINGVRFTPTHAVKNGRRYRYYTSQTVIGRSGVKPPITRLPAPELEGVVATRIHQLLLSPEKFITAPKASQETQLIGQQARDLAGRWDKLEITERQGVVTTVLRRVVLGKGTVWIELDPAKLVSTLIGQESDSGVAAYGPKANTIKLSADFRHFRRGGETRLVMADRARSERNPIPSLVKAIARARAWHERIISGEVGTIADISHQSGLPASYVKRVLQCAWLSPQTIEAVLSGAHSPDLTLRRLLHVRPGWQQQTHTIQQSRT